MKNDSAESQLSTCPKCGFDKLYVRYVKPEPSVVIGGTIKRGEQPERLKRECERCGYAWFTECKDRVATKIGAYHMSQEPRAQHLKGATRMLSVDGKMVAFHQNPTTGQWASEESMKQVTSIDLINQMKEDAANVKRDDDASVHDMLTRAEAKLQTEEEKFWRGDRNPATRLSTNAACSSAEYDSLPYHPGDPRHYGSGTTVSILTYAGSLEAQERRRKEMTE